MAKQLNVNMRFNADSSQAKKEIQALQESLRQLTMSSSNLSFGQGLNNDIRAAIRSATELSVHLEKATNIKTGNLDFSKLSQSIKTSGKTLSEYGDQLLALGPQGQQAFMQLTQAVVSSEVPFKRVSKLVTEFGTTLANTARWQLSSSVLHGFMGALQSAYGYAQDLNESLNNIRIVTGKSVDDMARFAKEANAAAKALNTTTTAYTDASLIYFQQGLNEPEVKKRADVTVKLANVSRQSAEEVSDQMTGIWNNFYDGSKSLEHYADVLTALGAATASSTEEIAGGLKKFAAIAGTIGLSYDYAAAALATLTSNTRESEEVVGTALKTIFARIQGLKLGETLEDGTNLNKYSQALATVGINIKDTSGNLKDMDQILGEMGSKWNDLSRAQQTALAQTVAGTRQYNQLMALMANWDNGDSDSFQANLATAQGADGSLQKQANIYADSWEAARDRVTASMEGLYEKLLDDEFFIDLLNSIEKIIGFVDHLIDSLGGVKGVLVAIGAIVTKLAQDSLAKGLQNMAYNLQMMTTRGKRKIQEEKQDYIKNAANRMAKAANTGEAGYDQDRASKIYEEQLKRQQQLLDNADKMSEIEKATTQALMDQLKMRGELEMAAAREVQQKQDALAASSELLQQRAIDKANASKKVYSSELVAQEAEKLKKGVSAEAQLSSLLGGTEQISTDQVMSIFSGINDPDKGIEIVKPQQLAHIRELSEVLSTAEKGTAEYQAAVDNLTQTMSRINTKIEQHAATITGASEAEIKHHVTAIREVTEAQKKQEQQSQLTEEANQQVSDSITKAKGTQTSWADLLVQTTNVALSAASAINMLGSMFNTLKDPDVSGWQKFVSVLTALSMLIPTLVSIWKTFKTLLSTETTAKIANMMATLAQAAAEKKLKKAKGESANATSANTDATNADTAKKSGSFFKKYNQGVWDKLSDKDKTFYENKAMSKKGFTKDAASGKWMKDGMAASDDLVQTTSQSSAGMGSMLKMAGGMALIAAGVAVAAGAIAWGIKQFNKYSDAAKKAAEVAQGAADAYAEVSENYNKFKSNLSDYKSAKDGLKDLTKGTLEYNEAVLKANESAQELINSGDLIMGQDYTINADTGLIEINEDSLKAAQDAQFKNMQKANSAKQIADLKAKEAQTKSDSINFLREDVQSTSGTWGAIGNAAAATGAGAGAGALIGAGIGSIVPVIGTAIGAVAGTIIGGVAGLVTGIVGASKGTASGKEQEALDKIAEEYKNNSALRNAAKADDGGEAFKAQLRSIGIAEDMIDSLAENREEVAKLSEEINANKEATIALTKQITTQFLSDNKAVQDSDYTEEIINAVNQTTQDRIDKEKAKLQDKGWGTDGISKATGVNAKAEEVFAEYARAAGLEGAKVIDTMGTDGNREFKYRTAGGDEITVDLDTMMDVVAKDNAEAGVDAAGTQLANTFNRLSASDVSKVNAAVNEDYSKLSIGQIKTGFSATASSLGLTKEDLDAMGLSEAEFNAKMAKASEIAQREWNDTLESHTTGASNAMTSIANSTQTGLQQISQGTLSAYGDMLEGFGSQGEMQSFNAALQGIMEANSDKAEDIMKAATGIDWSQGQVAIDQFNGMLQDMGINIENNATLWTSFQNAVNNMKFSVVNQSVEKLRSNLAEINKIAKNIKMGDIISDEDYKKIIEINGALKKDFVMTADGYMYVGAESLKEVASQATLTQLKTQKANNKKAADAYNQLQTGAFAAEDWVGLATGVDGDAASIAMAQQLASNTTIMDALGVDQGFLTDLYTTLGDSSASSEAKDAAREQLKKIFGDIQTLEANYKDGAYSDTRAEEIAASGMGKTELEAAVAAGEISADTAAIFNNVLDKKIEANKDIYREVNEELETINKNLSLIDKQKENAFGEEHLDLIKAETDELAKQVIAEKEKIELAKTKTASARPKLTADYGFTFNADGSIANYDDLYNLPEELWESAKKAAEDYNKEMEIVNNEELTMLTLLNDVKSQAVETYDAADASLAKYTQQFSHYTNVLDHYSSLMTLIGKEQDFAAKNVLLRGQSSIAKDKLTSSQSTFKMYSDEADAWQAKMDAVTDKTSDAFKAYQHNWEQASERARTAEETMLADLETWAQKEKEILENTLADLGRSLEQTLTGGKSFDDLSTQMERAKSLQEEYLTTTNKVYETTKMMRTAQQAIDASSNSVAKEKLKQFITQTKSLQDQGKLSQYELDMQQAKYDLLVAEIALEEAQNAKSTVRLQRDSEGNFGYVYTADQAAVSDAQQKFDDAQNALYNKGLEGANNYTEKYQQTMQEMYDKFGEIQQNYMAGSYASEDEYNNAMLAAKDYYYAKLGEYSNLYSKAVSVDSDIASEAWSSSFDNMLLSTNNWQSGVDTYLSQSSKAFSDWQTTIGEIEETTGADLTSLSDKVKGVTDSSDALLTALVGEDGQSGLIADLTSGFGTLATAIQNAVAVLMNPTAYELKADGTYGPKGPVASNADGGYTGAWGPSGKLAILHEKEMILTKDETSQFFKHLEMMESILSTLDFYAASQQFGGILNSPTSAPAAAGSLEQNVKIEASFPGVTDRNEIEEAFNNLVNKASQYANRK